MSLEHLAYTATWPEDYFLEEEGLGESYPHSTLISYLYHVFKVLLGEENYYIGRYMLILQPGFCQIAPDIMIAKASLGSEGRIGLLDWNTAQPDRPVPFMVFEISSDTTWPLDLNEKIIRYAQLGVKEYFTYDPDTPPVWPSEKNRLKGWRYENGIAQALQPDELGRSVSNELESYLTPDEDLLRIYSKSGELQLTELESYRQIRTKREILESDLQALLEKLRRNNIDIDKLQ